MSNEWLEKLARSLAGETLSSGAAGLGAGIGYAGAGGQFADIPDVMREEIEAFKRRTQPKSKNEQDAMEVLTALSVLPARLNPLGVAGHTIDFVKATPEMVQAKLSGAEPRTGEIMQGGLKRRLAKGGAQAEYALGNQLQRAKQAISKDGFEFQRIGQTVPLYSKSANWGPGEGKFQVIQNKASDAFDLNRATSDGLPGMGIEGKSRIITGQPHELGVEFANTHGLDPRYRDQGYGKQIYQNMADYYGGGISHSGSTTPEARHVYKSLGGIDTGIPSGGGTRQALPTTAMKADPEAMAAFQQKIDEYARQRSPIKGQETARQTLQDMIDQSSTRDIRDFEYQMQRATRSNGYVHESDISYLLDRIFNLNVQGGNVPNKIEIGGTTYIRLPNSAHFKKQQ